MEQVDSLNHKFTKVEAEDKTEVTMTDAIMISKAIRTDIGQIVETEDSIDRIEVGLGMNKTIGEESSEEMQDTLKNKIAEESIEMITEIEGYDRSRNRSRERSFFRSYSNNRNREYKQ